MSVRRIYDVIMRRKLRARGVVAGRFFTSESTEAKESKDEVVDITAADEKPLYSEDPLLQKEIEKKRNKSRLNPQHRNILMDVRPYDAPVDWFHHTVKYKKRMLGRYGLKAIDEPAGFAWPLSKEVEDAQEYERVAFPLSLQERWHMLKEVNRAKAEAVKTREAELTEKVAMMNQWTAELNAKIAKKEAQMEAARLRKERLIEEVRKHFGFKISVHDEKFKTMLAQKEKEEKKKKKEAKKKEKMEKLQSMAQEKAKEASQEQVTDSTKSVN
ncbi:hypothetical protein P5V15_002208 [Pogonomyrmex californicus]